MKPTDTVIYCALAFHPSSIALTGLSLCLPPAYVALSIRVILGAAVAVAGACACVTTASMTGADNSSTTKKEEVIRGKKVIKEGSAQAEDKGGLSALNPHPSSTSTPSHPGSTDNESRRQTQSVDPYPHTYSHLPLYEHPIVFPPHMPPSITSDGPVRVCVDMNTFVRTKAIDEDATFDWWSFNGGSPGPVIRLRQNDVLEIHFTNLDQTGMQHNIDFHAIHGQTLCLTLYVHADNVPH